MNKTFLTVSQVFIALNGLAYFIIGLFMFIMFNSMATVNELPELNVLSIVLVVLFALYVVVFIRMGQAKNNPYMKTEVMVWSILLIATSNMLAGIFGLVGALSQSNDSQSKGEESLEKRLKDLDNLFDRGLITLDEYHERRKRIIETA